VTACTCPSHWYQQHICNHSMFITKASVTLSRSFVPILHDLRNRDTPWYIRLSRTWWHRHGSGRRTADDRHRSGKATIVLNMFKTVMARRGTVTIVFVFVRTADVEVFVAFREESRLFVVRFSYDLSTVWPRLVRTVHDVLTTPRRIVATPVRYCKMLLWSQYDCPRSVRCRYDPAASRSRRRHVVSWKEVCSELVRSDRETRNVGQCPTWWSPCQT